MSLPYPVSPNQGDPGRPYLPNLPATGYTGTDSGPYPPGGPPSSGYPPNPTPGGYPSNPSSGPGYPPQPGYPSNPTSGGYPPNPASGGYPSPTSGGYPPNPASGGYQPYPPNPSPGGYPSNPSSGPGYPSNPSSGPGYPSNPSPASGYPSNPSSGPGYPSSSIYPNPNTPPETPSVYPSMDRAPGSGYPPSAPPESYTSSTFNTTSYPPSGGGYPGGISGGPPKSNFKILKPYISSGLDNLPLNEGLRDKIKQLSTKTETGDMCDFKNQNYKDIKSKLLKTKKLFEDPEFPASNSLLIDRYNGQDFIMSYFGRSRYDDKSIKWLRPHEICAARGDGKDPKMFVGATNRFDINQGELGNCWFLAALSNLVEDKKYLSQVIPPDQSFSSSYAGIFRFRFWRYGHWVEIVIDDRLPTRNGKLIYLRSIDHNEFWGALLEKAYAKLHGSYKALEGGLTIEASVDFTGGIPELISLDNLSMSKERLFYLMSSADSNGAFMGAAVTKRSGFAQEARSKGLQSQHAYTITKVVEIRSPSYSGGIPLIRIRNPHGNSKEWRGDWADGDKHWKVIPTHLRGKLGLTFEDDGEFYMSFSDFCRYFGELEMCHLTPDAAVVNFDPQSATRKRFELFNFSGSWTKTTSGGCGNAGQKSFSMNPQFFLDLKDPDPYDDELQCSIVISLLQKNYDRARSCIAIGFKVYKCNPGTTSLTESFLTQNLSIDRTETFMNLREVSKRLFLPEGRYCIIPCPFSKGDESEFLLRVFVRRSWGSSSQSQGKLVKETAGEAKKTDDYKFADDFDSRLNIHGHRYKGDGKGKVKNVAGKALNILEQHFPEGTKGIKKLKQFYNWAKDKDAEFDLLKKIIKSF